VHSNPDGFSQLEEFVSQKAYEYKPFGSILPSYNRIERFCLMFGLILRDLWMVKQAKTNHDIIKDDHVPDHVINSVHTLDDVLALDKTFIGPVLVFVKAALASATQASGATGSDPVEKLDISSPLKRPR
jgi:hypothetical protein